jgi:shikimate kinase
MMRFASGGKDEPAGMARERAIRDGLGSRSIVLVGMPGCGKSAIGRRLAPRLELPFVDVDEEIERAAGKTIKEIFADHGEPYFRDGERRVIARLLASGPQVLATGGGALLAEETRANVRRQGISIWVRADVPILVRRIMKRSNRPLFEAASRSGW